MSLEPNLQAIVFHLVALLQIKLVLLTQRFGLHTIHVWQPVDHRRSKNFVLFFWLDIVEIFFSLYHRFIFMISVQSFLQSL